MEKFFEFKVGGKPYEVGGKPTKWLTNVTEPTLRVYRPAPDKDSGVAMLICPGGGYHNLGWDVEGEEVAAWLNSSGVTGIILKYRCPRRPGDVMDEPPAGPLKDAQRAVSLVRSMARDWGIDPGKGRSGIVEFSAGGHLAGTTSMLPATHWADGGGDDLPCITWQTGRAWLWRGRIRTPLKIPINPQFLPASGADSGAPAEGCVPGDRIDQDLGAALAMIADLPLGKDEKVHLIRRLLAGKGEEKPVEITPPSRARASHTRQTSS